MHIDKEKIVEAKEKLGDRNAFIMAEELKLEGFDERNLKACCPFHNEDTPSFIYNPKNYTFHCFGCSKTVDILDVFMSNGNTYLEACEKLFELAEIPYSFGEKHVKTKRQYRYPKLEIFHDMTPVYKYLNLREISNETIDYLGITSDERGNCVFNYYDTNDVLTMVKYRPSHAIDKTKGEIKTWGQKDADTTPLLFNMNKINTNMPLLICEGEIDCAAAIESGYRNSVSVPFGAGNYTWIETNYDWLEQFSSIIIAADNDEAGNKMRKEVVYRLGSWRCKTVDIPLSDGQHPINDINEMMHWMGKQAVMDAIINAKEQPVPSVVDFSSVSEIDLSDIDGIYTGVNKVDKELIRLFYGTFNIFTGMNGSGKSTFLNQLICQSVDQDKNVWLYSRELPNYMAKNWLNLSLAGSKNVKVYKNSNGSEFVKVSPEAKDKIDQFYANKIYMYKDDYDNTLPDIQKSMEDSVRKYGCKLLIVDNLTAINFDCTDNEKWTKQVEFVNFCIGFAKKFHVAVILVIHPKKIETMRRLTKLDVQGLGSIVDLAHRLFSVHRVTKKEKEGIRKQRGDGWFKEPIKYDVILDILKDRMTGNEGMEIGMYYDKYGKRYFTSYDEYNHNYKWDEDNKMNLRMPNQLSSNNAERLFGSC